jgi:cytochrome c-type biogenesis protein CcmH/NrfG
MHYQKEELQAAAEHLRRSAALNPAVPETQWYLGLTALELKQWKEAEAAFRRFLELRPGEQQPGVYLYLASALDQQQRPAEAAEALRTYLNLIPPEQRTEKLKQLLARMEAKGRP